MSSETSPASSPIFDSLIYAFFISTFVIDLEKKVIMRAAFFFGFPLVYLNSYYVNGLQNLGETILSTIACLSIAVVIAQAWYASSEYLHIISKKEAQDISSTFSSADILFAGLIGAYVGLPESVYAMGVYILLSPIVFLVSMKTGLVDKIIPQAPFLIVAGLITQWYQPIFTSLASLFS